MLVVPRQSEVRLTYAARTWADRAGRSLFLAALALGAGVAGRSLKKPRRAAPVLPLDAVENGEPARGSTLLRFAPLLGLAAIAALRLAPERRPAVDVAALDERASRAYASERWEDAAEFARHALEASSTTDARYAELSCLRGEALLRAGHARLAAAAFAPVADAGGGPYRAQALFSGALAREQSGDTAGAAAWRARLRAEYPKTPWAERLEAGR